MALVRIIMLTAVTVVLIVSTTTSALALLPKGQLAPDFQLKDLSGNSHKLSDYRGKVVVIDFFGAYCGYCQDDAKHNLVPLYNVDYKNDANVQFLSVEVTDASAATIKSTYLAATGPIPWPVLTGGSSLVSKYDFQGVPILYLIDPAGKVALTEQYPTDVQTLKSTINALETRSASVLPAPAVCARGATSLDLFTKGADSALWWSHWDGTAWSASRSLGGYLTSSPAATSSDPAAIAVFVRGGNGALYERTTADGGKTWSAWASLGGQLATGTGPAACSWGSGRLDVFVTGTDGALYHRGGTTSWVGWQNLGGSLTSSPAAAAATGSSRIDVFVRGGDSGLWQRTYDKGWLPWAPI
jgi:thiol-disulfide isomerase/thioredoxin